MVGVALEFLEVEIRVIVKALASRLVELGVQCLALEPAVPPFALGQDLCLRGCKHAVEPAQYGHGQHDPLVLRGAVWAAQQVGDLPDQVCKAVVIRHRSGLLLGPLVLGGIHAPAERASSTPERVLKSKIRAVRLTPHVKSLPS